MGRETAKEELMQAVDNFITACGTPEIRYYPEYPVAPMKIKEITFVSGRGKTKKERRVVPYCDCLFVLDPPSAEYYGFLHHENIGFIFKPEKKKAGALHAIYEQPAETCIVKKREGAENER